MFDIASRAKDLNRALGRHLFAEILDCYGMPENGWALPMLVSWEDKRERVMHFAAGSHRIVGDAVDRVLVESRIGLKEYFATGGARTVAAINRFMIDMLVTEIDKFMARVPSAAAPTAPESAPE